MRDRNTLLVLGSTSFAGAWLVRQALDHGMDVVGVSRSPEPDHMFLPYRDSAYIENFKYHRLDVNKDTEAIIALLLEVQPAFIADFAGQGMVAPSWDWPEQWYTTNVASKARIINAINNHSFCKRYLRVSTPEVYGSTEDPIDETASYNPSTPYSVSHAAIDLHLSTYFKQFNFPVLIARFSNFFGPHQQIYRIVPRSICAALGDEILPLHGGGTSVRSFIHAKDVASGILLALEKGVIGETYHFSTEEFVTIRSLVERVGDLVGRDFNDFVEVAEDRPGKDSAYLMNAKKAVSHLGWKPLFDLDTGLEETYRWVLSHHHSITSADKSYQHKP